MLPGSLAFFTLRPGRRVAAEPTGRTTRAGEAHEKVSSECGRCAQRGHAVPADSGSVIFGDMSQKEMPPQSPEELLERYKAGERVFRKANLEGANLEGANLEGAKLQGAYLQGHDLDDLKQRGAILDEDASPPEESTESES